MRLTTLGVLLVAAVFITGCRTYGGYGSEQALYDEIVRLVQQFDNDLARSRGELAAIEQAAATHPELARVYENYSLMLDGHQVFLEEQREIVEQLSPGSTYRHLHRVHGAILAAQRTARNQKASLARAASEILAADAAPAQQDAQAVDATRPYALIPPYYIRVAQDQGRTDLSNIVRGLGSGGEIDVQPGAPGDEDPSGVDAESDADVESDAGAGA